MNKIVIICILLVSRVMLSQLPIKMDRDNQILEYNGYKVSYNETHEQSNWVLYKIKRGDFICDEGSERKNRFRDDKDIETGSSHSDDYIRSGYDRGHLKPAGVEPCDQDRIDETFNMVNISPQHPSFNRGIWRKLENYERVLCGESDSLIVYSGPILSNDLKKIGDVSVPEYFFKIIYIYKGDRKGVSVYYIPNKKSNKDITDFIVPLSFINRMTGFVFPE